MANAGWNPWDMALKQLDDVAKRMGLDADTHAVLAKPKRVLIVSIPVRMDNGAVKVFEGCRVHHNLARGPGQGRHPLPPGRDLGRGESPGDVDDLEVRRGQHPLRRRQGRHHLQPEGDERRRSSSASPAATPPRSCRIIGPESDIPAPDVNTTPQVMAWIMDTYSMNRGYSVPSIVTGKPIAIGGSLGRNEATARGCVFVIQAAAKRHGLDTGTPTAVIQGYGNAGAIAARLLARERLQGPRRQ